MIEPDSRVTMEPPLLRNARRAVGAIRAIRSDRKRVTTGRTITSASAGTEYLLNQPLAACSSTSGRATSVTRSPCE